MQRFGCSQRNALRIVRMSCSTYRYESRRADDTALKMRIKEITDQARALRLSPGARDASARRHPDNVKRVYRLYREEGLSLRLKRPRRNKAAKWRQPKQLCASINEI